MERLDLRIDVSASVPLPGPLKLAVSVYLPDPARVGPAPLILYAVPGGGFSKTYFDMSFPGRTAYSQAAHHVERGLIFVAIDHLGVGQSSIPDLSAVTLEMMAAAYDHAVRALTSRFQAGTLAPGFPALPRHTKIGIGQSMGGCVTIVTQGRHSSFDAVAPLGFSAIHTVLPQPTQAATEATIAAALRLRRDGLTGDALAQFHASITDFRYHHHWSDVPEDILAIDEAKGEALAPFRSATMPNCGAAGLLPGCVAAEAAAIEAPVLIAMGERDVCRNPRAEPAAYLSARDITLFIAPTMAHMHNFASTRTLFWDRIESWARRIAADGSTTTPAFDTEAGA